MTRTAEQTARAAEASQTNRPGYCLQWCRERAEIPARYPDATTAWHHTNDRHPADRQIPRGAMAYWTGGSSGYGHIAVGLGGGRVRSTDANGSGQVATRTLAWFDTNWPSITYAGWAWDVNETTIPHQEEEDMPYRDWPDADKQALANDVSDAVWAELMTVLKPDGTKVVKTTDRLLREIWSKLAKHMDTG